MTFENDKIEALVKASANLVRELEEQVVIHNIIANAAKVIDAESCSVILLDEPSGEFWFYTTSGPDEKKLEKIRFKKEMGIAGKSLKTGEAILVEDAAKYPEHYRGVDQQTGVITRSLMCVPINIDKRTVGVLEAVNKRGQTAFSRDDLKLLTLYANFAAIALQNARTFDRYRTDAEAFRLAADRGRYYLGVSAAMQSLWTMVLKVAATNSTVLITGESGSGKEVVAATLHAQSPRKDRPFICLNCAALDANLLTSELFGHERGAFTGAMTRHIGRFELAGNGTIFLDEIASMELAVQARFLRVLENQQFERLGGSETVRTNARVIAATNTDLAQIVAQGRFREDLYHRLNVIFLRVPPLREHVDDLPGLFDHFARFFAFEIKREPIRLNPEALAILNNYRWPGNVRELKNLVERASVLLPGDTLTKPDLLDLFPSLGQKPVEGGMVVNRAEPNESLWDTEKRMIEETLAANHWNQSQAARALGISRHHLRYRVMKYRIALPAAKS